MCMQVLESAYLPKGVYKYEWEPTVLSPGLYFARLLSGDKIHIG